MLRRHSSERIYETVLRHKFRNLRAKVMTLLPAEKCTKHQKRNRNVGKMEYNRQQQNKNKTNLRWTHNNTNSSHYFQEACENQQRYTFDKLSNNEIQQIKQNKLYYLGEKHMNAFQQYIQGGKNKNKGDINQLQFIKNKDSSAKKSQFKINLPKKLTQSVIRIAQIEQKYKNVIQKRKILHDQQRFKKQLLRKKNQMKIQKVLANYNQITKHNIQQIKIRNNQNYQKTTSAQFIKKNRQNCSNIILIQQKVRDICLKRITKSQSCMRIK